ncbi:hypothetical protein JTE90_028957 [Oedothorax gibbosus]|uniref:Uncharacterized protein n=1 Tax=Oedothorax gibbosus TaxID=931172 RepID=A0AAV6VIT3_9ARAC|nr:hypothetical protein JTE90_028957 [Oedothorax gibbosus]
MPRQCVTGPQTRVISGLSSYPCLFFRRGGREKLDNNKPNSLCATQSKRSVKEDAKGTIGKMKRNSE